MFDDIVVTDINEIFTVFSPKGRFEKIQNRNFFGLSFCDDGRITYMHKGNKIISDKNHAVILPEGQTYTLYGDKSGSFTVINFTCTHKICDTIISVSIQNTEVYLMDFAKLQSLSLFDGNRTEMLSILYHMFHRMSTQSSPCNVIIPAIKFLESNYQNPAVTNADLARLCNISEVYFRRIFTKHYKTTPKQFMIDIRINKAKQMLAEGALKIGAVAERCGFSNQYHFCRIFKEKTGITPTEYVKQNRIYKI